MLGKAKISLTVKQSLLFHNTLMPEFRKKYKKASRQENKSLNKLFADGLMKKYKLVTFGAKPIGSTIWPVISQAKRGDRGNGETVPGKR